RRGRRITARPGDRTPGERVAARVLRGRRVLHGLIHLDRRRGRRDVDRGDRWGRWGRWRRWWRRDVERVAGREGERSRGRLQHIRSEGRRVGRRGGRRGGREDGCGEGRRRRIG